jgi:hypothetical protein
MIDKSRDVKLRSNNIPVIKFMQLIFQLYISTYIISLLLLQVHKEFKTKENAKHIHHIDIENV